MKSSKQLLAILTFFLLLNNLAAASGKNGKIFFDVKTHFTEKAQLTHIKNMVDYLLFNSDWAGITEVGEEYELWMENYRKEKNGNRLDVQLDITVRKPGTMLKDGEKVFRKHLAMEISFDFDNTRPPDYFELYKKLYNNVSNEIAAEASAVGEEVYKILLRNESLL